MTENTNSMRTNKFILNPVMSATSMPGVVVSLHVATSIPMTPMPSHTPLLDHMPSYFPIFTMPLVSRDFPYGMPTAMMAGLQSNASTYVNNNITINPHMESGYAIIHPGRDTQH